MRTTSVLLLLVALGVGVGPAPVQADDVPLNKRVSTFKKLLRGKDPKGRERAFEILRGAEDPAVIDAITWGMKEVRKAERKITAQQHKIEAEYQGLFSKLEDAKMAFESSNRSGRDMERYNKAARKLGDQMDDAVKALKNLENDYTRSQGMRTQAILAAADVLERLEGAPFEDALARLTAQWLNAKELEDRLAWVDAVSEVDAPAVTRALHAVAKSAEMDTVLRVRAIDALAARQDGAMFGDALAMLKLPRDQQPLLLAAIRLLRHMHDKRGIEPLIEFLAREDLKRERTDAHLALVSLTGVDHGVYPGEWRKWWEDQGPTFQMPKDPKPTGNVRPPKKGTTFYGIQTLSDKVLFIVDLSGSMDKQQKGAGSEGKTKWDVLKQQLTGAVFGLRPTDTFNVIFFNHALIPWQAKKVEATERNKRLLKDWVEDKRRQPLGGTNIYDALELGFKIAHRTTGPPDLDTVFFLTDGRPTAGKIRDRQRMLQIFEAWNKSAHLTIHAVGVGAEHDIEFMKALARIGDGRYVSTLHVPDIEVSVPPAEKYGAPVLDFGEAKVGQALEHDVTIANRGNGTLRIEDIRTRSRSGTYRLGPGVPSTPLTLEKNETATVKVLYSPTAAGSFEGTLRIQSNDGGDRVLNVTLTGTAVE